MRHCTDPAHQVPPARLSGWRAAVVAWFVRSRCAVCD